MRLDRKEVGKAAIQRGVKGSWAFGHGGLSWAVASVCREREAGTPEESRRGLQSSAENGKLGTFLEYN